MAGLSSGRQATTAARSGMARRRCTRRVISSTTSGRSPGGSPIDHERYALWLHVGQSSDKSARTRGGCSSPGSEYEVSQETSPRNTSTWNRSSTAWRCNSASSSAVRVWVIRSTRMWSSMARPRLPLTPWPSRRRTRGSDAASSPTRTSAAPGRRRRPPSSRSAAPWSSARPASSSMCTPPPIAISWCATTPRWTGRPTGTGPSRR